MSNPYDSEAIKVIIKDIGKVGYVANTPYTKATGTFYKKLFKNKGQGKKVTITK